MHIHFHEMCLNNNNELTISLMADNKFENEINIVQNYNRHIVMQTTQIIVTY